MARREVLLVTTLLAAPMHWSCDSHPTDPGVAPSPPAPSPPAWYITPRYPTVQRGQELRLEIVTSQREEGLLPLPQEVQWTSPSPSVATVSPQGVVRGVGPGSTRIRATCDLFILSVTVYVK